MSTSQPQSPGEVESDIRKKMISIDGLTKVYPSSSGQVTALKDVTTSIDSGEFVSVVGPSGCGKSTLMMILAGLTPPTGGSVEIRGKRIDSPYTDLGIVFQRDVLMPWRTTIRNILVQAEYRNIPKEEMRPRAVELLNMVGLFDCEEKYPHELSGGMRQRVSICRALVHDPELLLMDEPFGALDALTREQLNLDLQDIWLKARKSVVFITHSISEAVFLGDRVIVMGSNPGRIVEDIRVDIPRPRSEADKSSKQFAEHTSKIRERFEDLGVLRRRNT